MINFIRIKYFITNCLAFSVLFSVSAQQLYMPRDVTAAFQKETRSPDGKPGDKYWQNYGRYDITITALPPNRTITGDETITYINKSPDTLKYLSIKLFLNIHKPGAPRNMGVSPDYLTSGMHIDDVAIDGEDIEWKDNPGNFTSHLLPLPKSLAPNDSLEASFKWHYEISLESYREGMIDSTTYFLAYFYPRIAVYDDINGWDKMNFTDSHEFYSDFNDYTVTVNVPKNYIVWGTGTLQRPETLLQPEILSRFNKSLSSNAVIHVVTNEDLINNKVTNQSEINSWQFKAVNMPDMAFAISNYYLWDAASIIVDDKSKRRASVQSAYLETTIDYQRMVEYGIHTLDYFGKYWPGVPYPYEKITFFQGFADMEYPMMANILSIEDPLYLRLLAEHELAHTYMPFYVGTNETRYGFMDEGWATAFEFLIGIVDRGLVEAEEDFKQYRAGPWINDPSSSKDIAVITPGDALAGGGFFANQYGKAPLGFLAIKDFLGDDLFKKCLHAFINRWNGKHPIPWDFFNTFNDVSELDLNWLWTNWFFSTNYIDLAIQGVKQSESSATVFIINVGGMAAPVTIEVTFSDGTSERFHQTPAIWQSDQKQAKVTINTKKKISTLKLDGGIWMDADETNNFWSLKE